MTAKKNTTPAKTKQEFLNSLPEWDSVKRIDTMLIDYLGARDNSYVRDVSRTMMISAVARALEENSISTITPMLIGPQGCGKSVFIQKLGSGYSELASAVSMKTARMLEPNLLVEVCELKRPTVELVRRPEPFLVVITYNVMPEGLASRYIMPVRVGINDTGLVFTMEQCEANQLWAEAVAAYKNGERPFVGVRDNIGYKNEMSPIPKKHPYGVG